ncbi:MAG: fibrobacter succinogenes major paralogous domain-containing protein, partial [Paludibacter sp.]
EAGSNAPANFLDYKDYVLLECTPLKLNNALPFTFYIAISPTVPRAGEGYGFNTPGSPSWNDVFINPLWKQRLGEEKYRLDIRGVSYKTAGSYAKAIWKGGFKVINAKLIRAGGLDADRKKNNSSNDDFWNTPENTTTQNDLKQKEGSERIKQLSEEGKDKYKALKNSYTLNVNNRDTVSEASIQVIKSLNSYFENGTITLKSVSKGTINTTANDINTNLQLTEGWNTLRIALKGDNYNLRDSVKVYYKKAPKDSRFGTMTDQQGNVYKTVKIGNQVWMAENLRTTIYNDGSEIQTCIENKNICNSCGLYYKWESVNSEKLAPKGWHIPNNDEWQKLIDNLGGLKDASSKMRANELPKLKSEIVNCNYTNESIFLGFNCGYYSYGYEPRAYLWWSITRYNSFWGYFLCLWDDVTLTCGFRQSGSYNVRCIKD